MSLPRDLGEGERDLCQQSTNVMLGLDSQRWPSCPLSLVRLCDATEHLDWSDWSLDGHVTVIVAVQATPVCWILFWHADCPMSQLDWSDLLRARK